LREKTKKTLFCIIYNEKNFKKIEKTIEFSLFIVYNIGVVVRSGERRLIFPQDFPQGGEN
jgi:hypothetical protein